MTSATKVGDLFSAAGEAFTKLAELALVIQTAINQPNFNDDSGWSTDDTELLQLAVKRFGDELNVISEHIKDKTMCQIKSTFRKIQPSLSSNGKTDELSDVVNVSSQQSASLYPSTSLEETSTNRVKNLPLSGDSGRSQHLHSSSMSMASEGLSSSIMNTSNINNAIASSPLLSRTPTVTSTALTLAASSTTASICSSPSPFLHYPLLRKSADITLNMLNARDDSDDEDRLSSSVF